MKSVLQSNWTMAEIEKLDPANGGSNDRHREARKRGGVPWRVDRSTAIEVVELNSILDRRAVDVVSYFSPVSCRI